jgi:hemerythrin superfamily protein
MNVIELLKKDHETVAGLFESFESAKESESDGEKEQLAGRICEALTVHATVEEELFYPAVAARAREDEKAEDGVKEAQEEHALLKTLVSELEGMSSDDEQFDAKVKVLKDVVEHHVKEEEGELMPRAKMLLSSEDLDQIGSQLASRKQELESEPATAGAGATAKSRSSSKSRGRSSGAPRPRPRSSSRASARTSRASHGARSRTRSRSR